MSRYPMPCLEHYWTMWNSSDLDVARTHLDAAVADDVEFCDPLDHHVGRDELFANVRRFRRRFPGASFVLRSGFDHHHTRFRYRWDMLDADGAIVVEGTDVTTVTATTDDGVIQRIDGFFGSIPGLGDAA